MIYFLFYSQIINGWKNIKYIGIYKIKKWEKDRISVIHNNSKKLIKPRWTKQVPNIDCIYYNFLIEFAGVVHPRGFRDSKCVALGTGDDHVNLKIPLITEDRDPSYCGVRVNTVSHFYSCPF